MLRYEKGRRTFSPTAREGWDPCGRFIFPMKVVAIDWLEALYLFDATYIPVTGFPVKWVGMLCYAPQMVNQEVPSWR